MKFIAAVISIVLFSCALIFLAGYTAREEWNGEISEVFRDTPQVVWNLITDVENYHRLKQDVVDVRIIKNNFGYMTWREELTRGGHRTYRVSQRVYPELFSVELIDSSVGKTGTFTYKVSRPGQWTIVSVTEEGKTTNAWERGLDFLRGRDYGLRREMKWIRVAAFGRLLTAP